MQTTFLNAFRGLRRGVVPEAEAAWLFKIAENVCLTRQRSAWRRRRVESPSDLQAFQDVTPAREGGSGDELIPLGDALAAMPDAQRRAILLREWQGLSYKEIAAEMDVSPSAVETLIFRARRSLANALETPWQERRTAKQAGRAGQAFNLASVLAWLKTLFVGGTAAKVAVVAVAATGTAALAVAEVEHRQEPQRVKPSPAAERAPDSASHRPRVFAASDEPAFDSTSPPTRTAQVRGGIVPKMAGRSEADVAATQFEKTTKTPPGKAKEPGTPAIGHGKSARPEPKAKAKHKVMAKATTKAKTKPKVRSKPKVRRKPKRTAPASGSVAPAPSPPPSSKPKPEPSKPEPTKPEASAPPPPPPAAPSEKEKAKGGSG